MSEVTAPVRDELDRVQAELLADLMPGQRDQLPLVEHVARYRGKQLRPTLVFLSGRAVGPLTDAHITVAKVVELIHTATLVHDDILDGANMRRQLPTLNAMHGNEVSVLLGDYIYARAFQLSVSMDDQTCSRMLSDVTRTICQGEITQILHRFDYAWTEERYFEVIADKTASLYAAACRLGAHYSGASAAVASQFERYGLELGIAFQIVDDVLDLGGDEAVVGKTLGSDLDKGKLTLPLLWLLRERTTGDRLRSLMGADSDRNANGNGHGRPVSRLPELRRQFDLQPAIDYALDHARARIDRAMGALDDVPDSAAKDAMLTLGQYVLSRRL
jgi:octaprenyl-diphosphate synthase